MKISYISSSIIPSRTANSIHVMKMGQAFLKNGHSVILIYPDKKNLTEESVDDIYNYYGVASGFLTVPVPWYGFLGHKIASLIYAIKAAKFAKDSKAELVYCRNLLGAFIAAVFFRMKVSFEAHAPVNNASFYSRLIFKLLVNSKNFVKLVVISGALYKYFLQEFRVDSELLHLAPDGADNIKDCTSKQRFQSKNLMSVGYIGHLYPGRGVELILELSELLPKVDFHLVGGTEEDLAFWKNKLLSSKNIYFHGFVPPSEVESYRISFDVLLAPYQDVVSVSGGGGDTAKWMSPLKVFEYMAAGKIIICSDLPSLREILTHKVNAILCAPNDVQAWYNALLWVMDNPVDAAEIANSAYEEFTKKYTWEERARGIIEKISW